MTNKLTNASAKVVWNDALTEARAAVSDLQNNLETFGHSEEVARVALDGALDAIDELRALPAEESATNTAPEFLHRAATIMEERGKQYDKPGGERSMGKTVAAFNAITGRDLTEAEGWLLLETLKNVRLWQKPGFHQDSADDGVAYSALKAEAKSKETSHVPT